MKEALGIAAFVCLLAITLMVGWLVFEVGTRPEPETVTPISAPVVDQVEDRMLDCLSSGYTWNGYAQSCEYAGPQP